MDIAARWLTLMDEVRACALAAGRDPAHITVVAASKYADAGQMRALFAAGCRHFGENRLQEALLKQELLADLPITWHMIGTLQKNKARKAVGRFALIHSVDSYELAAKLAEASAEMGVTTPILLQVNIAGEASKHGLAPTALAQQLTALLALPHLAVQGLMTMAPLAGGAAAAQRCFAGLACLRDVLLPAAGAASLAQLSMGMSGDWRLAVAAGATILRIGSALFAPPPADPSSSC